MNNKDNQEAELSGEAKFHIEVCRAMALINQSIGCVSDANGLEAKNILRLALYDYAPTTPQVNEEVASGEVVAWKYRYTKEGDWQVSLTPTNETDMEWLKFTYKEFEIVPLYLHPPAPSPSNVLVEALQRDNTELKDFIAKAFLAHPNLDLDIEALATYSASTDSVTISRSEYEAMNKMLEAARKTLTENSHLADGDVCTLYELREAYKAIDTARKAS